MLKIMLHPVIFKCFDIALSNSYGTRIIIAAALVIFIRSVVPFMKWTCHVASVALWVSVIANVIKLSNVALPFMETIALVCDHSNAILIISDVILITFKEVVAVWVRNASEIFTGLTIACIISGKRNLALVCLLTMDSHLPFVEVKNILRDCLDVITLKFSELAEKNDNSFTVPVVDFRKSATAIIFFIAVHSILTANRIMSLTLVFALICCHAEWKVYAGFLYSLVGCGGG
jgi:hypothetical protein